jgi:hypothetical protein
MSRFAMVGRVLRSDAQRPRFSLLARSLRTFTTTDFARFHKTLQVTPAMADRVTTRLFEVMDLMNLLIEAESKKAA